MSTEESLKRELATRFGLSNVSNSSHENPMLRTMRMVQIIPDDMPLGLLGRAMDIIVWARVNRLFLRMIDLEPEPANLSLVHGDSNEDWISGSGLLTEEEIDALEKLGLNEHYEVGTHFGAMAIERIE